LISNRFRDRKGNAVPLSAAWNAASALTGAMLRVGLHHRPARPTISQTAARRLRRLLPREAWIAEFGSGLSTIWFARHFARVVAVEHEKGWAKLVQDRLAREKLANVDYLVADPADYIGALDGYPDGSFDFMLVDGLDRDGCLTRALPKVKAGGYVYVDNTDADLDTADGEMRRTERRLTEAVRQSGGTLEYFTDFAPINFFAEQGALARLGPNHR
jgi:hypothetical protein